MTEHKFDFHFIKNEIRKKTFGIITTLNKDGSPHTSGILYGVSNQDEKFALYLLTYKKNKKVSFIIPFPHHILRFVPSGAITINGIAKILPVNTKEMIQTFSEKKILRQLIADIDFENDMEYVFVKIEPDPKIFCYGVGFNILELRSSHTTGGYSVTIPDES